MDKFQRIHLFPGDKGFHHLYTEAAGKTIDDDGAQYRAGEAKKQTLPGAEGEASGDLHHFSWHDSHHHLKHLDADEGQAAQYPLILGPGPEAFRVGGKGEDTAAEGESDEKKYADQAKKGTKAHCFAPASIAALFLLRGTI